MAALNFFDILTIRPNFFDDADIDSRIDKEELKMAILERCGTLFPLYTDSQMFKAFSDSFFKRKKNIISKLIDSTEFNYNPIDNYDKTEEMDRNYSGNSSNESHNESSSSSNNNQENKVSAFDNSEYLPKDNSTVSSQNSITTGASGSGEDSETESIRTHTRGNIGVTTTQELINSERKVVRFDIYNWVAIEFEQHFFICVS